MLFEIIFRIMPSSDDNYVLKKILKHCSKLIFKINLITITHTKSHLIKKRKNNKRKNFFIKFLNLIK